MMMLMTPRPFSFCVVAFVLWQHPLLAHQHMSQHCCVVAARSHLHSRQQRRPEHPAVFQPRAGECSPVHRSIPQLLAPCSRQGRRRWWWRQHQAVPRSVAPAGADADAADGAGAVMEQALHAHCCCSWLWLPHCGVQCCREPRWLWCWWLLVKCCLRCGCCQARVHPPLFQTAMEEAGAAESDRTDLPLVVVVVVAAAAAAAAAAVVLKVVAAETCVTWRWIHQQQQQLSMAMVMGVAALFAAARRLVVVVVVVEQRGRWRGHTGRR